MDGKNVLNDKLSLAVGGKMAADSIVFNKGMENEQIFKADGISNKLVLTPSDGNFTSDGAVIGNTLGQAACGEYIIEVNAKQRGSLTVYAAAPDKTVVLVNSDGEIADAGVITAESEDSVYVPKLNVPKAGIYKVLISDRTSSVDLYAIDFKYSIDDESKADIDNDGLVTAHDAELLLKKLCGIPAERSVSEKDTDDSDSFDILDIIAIEEVLANKENAS